MITDLYLQGKGFSTVDKIIYTRNINQQTYDIVYQAYYYLNGYPSSSMRINSSEQIIITLKDNSLSCSWHVKGKFIIYGKDLSQKELDELFVWLNI